MADHDVPQLVWLVLAGQRLHGVATDEADARRMAQAAHRISDAVWLVAVSGVPVTDDA